MKHICGQCKKSFSQESDYLIHECPVFGGTPKNPSFIASGNKTPSQLEKKILAAVRVIRQEKKDNYA